MKRTNYCGEIDSSFIGKRICLSGWVHRIRHHGSLIFVDLRDRSGLVQLVFNPSISQEAYNIADSLGVEWVITVDGIVRERPEGMKNPKIKTGDIEIEVFDAKIENTAKSLPFNLWNNKEVDENVRLKYRYLDLRREKMQRNLLLRHKLFLSIRNFLDRKGFIEIETPNLIVSTPEGARDFIIPSRLQKGKFYALPQSPQLFKQLLMVAGFDRYFQIARCFRDEDLRADRQPEFTQLDIEMSFVNQEDIFNIIEELFSYVLKEVFSFEIKIPFPKLSFDEAYENYGTDKPDLRYDMKIMDFTEVFSSLSLNFVQKVISEGGNVKGLILKSIQPSRKEWEVIEERSKNYGSSGIIWFSKTSGELRSSIKKYIDENFEIKFNNSIPLEDGDSLILIAGKRNDILKILGRLRLDLCDLFRLKPKEGLYFLWITDFPLFEIDKDTGRIVAEHHPFTSPREEDLELIDTDPLKVRAQCYDLVLNGVELGSGSIRIHKREIQEKIFKILNLSQEEIEKRFGFLLEAFEYGAPPHGGIALGLDRIMAILTDSNSLREVIAFPKTQSGTCLLTGAPSEVDPQQLKEVHICISPD
ncbi:MAG: aspartate--tRNA ligase [Dictyoglomus sp.]|nr:aspartate--tRNA ligase [Dictyoglomus sp.]MCX7942719.1 aspartate--tRNA ligase [Dictyoglomaceae bacterium]MDW8189267.1 aspartate--tRNA ligase [Dictyoglomus sp.]